MDIGEQNHDTIGKNNLKLFKMLLFTIPHGTNESMNGYICMYDVVKSKRRHWFAVTLCCEKNHIDYTCITTSMS